MCVRKRVYVDVCVLDCVCVYVVVWVCVFECDFKHVCMCVYMYLMFNCVSM